MKLREINQPHSKEDQVWDVLADKTGGELTARIIKIYETTRKQSEQFMLNVTESYAAPYIEEILDELSIINQGVTEHYLSTTKSGKMLIELNRFFSEK